MSASTLRLRPRHEAIIRWMLTYPERSQGDCAEYFGYTQAWLSTLVNSDMFKAAFKEASDDLNGKVFEDVKDKLNYLAQLSLDRAAERIEGGAASERFLGDTMKTALTALGYGAPAAQVNATQQNVHIHLDADRLTQARERAAALRNGSTALKGEGGLVASPSPSENPAVLEGVQVYD